MKKYTLCKNPRVSNWLEPRANFCWTTHYKVQKRGQNVFLHIICESSKRAPKMLWTSHSSLLFIQNMLNLTMRSKRTFLHIRNGSSRRDPELMRCWGRAITALPGGSKVKPITPMDSAAQELSIDMLHYTFCFLHLFCPAIFIFTIFSILIILAFCLALGKSSHPTLNSGFEHM